jgi:hypothetical protein
MDTKEKPELASEREPEDPKPNSKIKIQAKRFLFVTEKFDKDAWASGEGGGGEHDGGER